MSALTLLSLSLLFAAIAVLALIFRRGPPSAGAPLMPRQRARFRGALDRLRNPPRYRGPRAEAWRGESRGWAHA